MTTVRLSPSGQPLTGQFFAGELRYDDVIDTATSGSQIDYAPTGFTEDSVGVRISPPAALVLRGMTLADGQQIVIRVGRLASFPVIIMPEDATADAGKRFTCPNAMPVWMKRGESVLIRNDEGRNNVSSVGQCDLNVISRNSGIVTANGAATELSLGGVVTFPANTLLVPALYRFTAYYEFVHTAAATPLLNFGLAVNGTAAYGAATPASNAGTFLGKAEAFARVSSVGAGGAWRTNTVWTNPSGLAITDQLGGLVALPAVDTTAQSTIEFRGRMATGVASNVLTVYNAVVEQLG